MSVAATQWLWLLVAVAGAAGAYVVRRRRAPRDAVMFTNVELLRSFVSHVAWRRHLLAVGYLTIAVLLVVVLARPQHLVNVTTGDSVPLVVLAIDASNSMRATDVAPTRLGAAREQATSFVHALGRDAQVGLVVFTADVLVGVLPTTQHTKVVTALRQIHVGSGTAIADGVLAALAEIDNAVTSSPGRLNPEVLVISDGEPTAGSTIDDAITAATRRHVPVSSIAVGTAKGTVALHGTPYNVPVETDVLHRLASATHGTFHHATNASALKLAYTSLESAAITEHEQQSLVPWFLGLAVVLSVLVATGSLIWSGHLP